MAGRSASAFPARYHDRAQAGASDGGGAGSNPFDDGNATNSLMEDPHYVNTLTEDERDLIAEVLNRDAKIKDLEDKR